LIDEKARSSLDAQDKVTGVVVVAKVGDESDVWLGVHVELSQND
jgi:hypothetical protein